METYHAYNTNASTRLNETLTVNNGYIQLRHIPLKGSIVINNFLETNSFVNIGLNEFFCAYSLETYYRDANRLVLFNPNNDGKSLNVSYVAVGTPVTADDMNEIKSHIENNNIHSYTLPTASSSKKGGVKVGNGLQMSGEVLSVKLGYGLEFAPDGSIKVTVQSSSSSSGEKEYP